jgi:hypothetical protein
MSRPNVLTFCYGTYRFPDELTGIDGEPSTGSIEEYKVIFAFMSIDASSKIGFCTIFEKNFNCRVWVVIPEFPFGSLGSHGFYNSFREHQNS